MAYQWLFVAQKKLSFKVHYFSAAVCAGQTAIWGFSLQIALKLCKCLNNGSCWHFFTSANLLPFCNVALCIYNFVPLWSFIKETVSRDFYWSFSPKEQLKPSRILIISRKDKITLWHGIFLVRYWTKIRDAGMPMPALVSSMPMPGYMEVTIARETSPVWQRWAPALFSRFRARERQAKKRARKREEIKARKKRKRRARNKQREFALFLPPSVEIRF